MAASGYTPIILFNSTTTGNAPTTSNLAVGELAINVTDGKLFFNQSGTIKVLANATYATSVSTISFGTTGLTPSTATNGVVTVAGTLATTNGGTGQTSLATGSLGYGQGTSAHAALAIGTAGQILTVNSGATAPQWSTLSGVAVTTFSAGTTGLTPSTATTGAVTLAGTLATTNGGTGLTSFTSGGVVYASSTSALATGSALTFDGTNLSSTGGATFLGSPSGYGGGEVRLGPTTADTQSAISTQSTGSPQLIFDHRGTSNTGSYIWRNGSGGANELMRLNSTGLGIGTSSPGAKLQVSSASDDILRLTATAPYLSFYNGATRTGYIRANTSGVFGIVSEDASTPMAFYTAGAEKMRLDTSGNLGLGVTPSTFNYPFTNGTFQMAAGFSMAPWSSNASMYISTNAYYNSGWKYNASSKQAAQYFLGDGGHAWSTSASGTAGNAITFTQAMTLDASGNLGIGTTSPGQKLSVYGGTIRCDLAAAGTSLILTGTGSNFQVSHNSSNYVTLLNSGGGLLLQSGNSVNFGVIQYNTNTANKSVRWVITQGDGGTNTVQVYWNSTYGSAQAGGCLGAYDQSGNYASPGTSISGSNNWAIYGFVSYSL